MQNLLEDSGISAEAVSNVLTHVTKQLEGINFDRLEGVIINTVDTPIDNEGNMGQSNGDSHGNWSNLPVEC